MYQKPLSETTIKVPTGIWVRNPNDGYKLLPLLPVWWASRLSFIGCKCISTITDSWMNFFSIFSAQKCLCLWWYWVQGKAWYTMLDTFLMCHADKSSPHVLLKLCDAEKTVNSIRGQLVHIEFISHYLLSLYFYSLVRLSPKAHVKYAPVQTQRKLTPGWIALSVPWCHVDLPVQRYFYMKYKELSKCELINWRQGDISRTWEVYCSSVI